MDDAVNPSLLDLEAAKRFIAKHGVHMTLQNTRDVEVLAWTCPRVARTWDTSSRARLVPRPILLQEALGDSGGSFAAARFEAPACVEDMLKWSTSLLSTLRVRIRAGDRPMYWGKVWSMTAPVLDVDPATRLLPGFIDKSVDGDVPGDNPCGWSPGWARAASMVCTRQAVFFGVKDACLRNLDPWPLHCCTSSVFTVPLSPEEARGLDGICARVPMPLSQADAPVALGIGARRGTSEVVTCRVTDGDGREHTFDVPVGE